MTDNADVTVTLPFVDWHKIILCLDLFVRVQTELGWTGHPNPAGDLSDKIAAQLHE